MPIGNKPTSTAALEIYDAHNAILADMQEAIEARKVRVITMKLKEHKIEVDESLPIEERFHGLSVTTRPAFGGFVETYDYKGMHLAAFMPVKVVNTYADGEFRTQCSQKYV